MTMFEYAEILSKSDRPQERRAAARWLEFQQKAAAWRAKQGPREPSSVPGPLRDDLPPALPTIVETRTPSSVKQRL
jgi:hypothetical protein